MQNIKFVFVTGDAKDLKKRLVSNQPSPLQYNSPKPELAEEDAVIQKLKINFTADGVEISQR